MGEKKISKKNKKVKFENKKICVLKIKPNERQQQ